MNKSYTVPDNALKKLRAARSLEQTVYIYGATGYGKTELVMQYLSKRRYRYISCAEDTAELFALTKSWQSGGEKELGSRQVVVVDDLCLGRKEIAAYMEAQGVSATEEELESVCANSQGNAYTVHHTVLKMQEGMRPGQKLAEEVRRDFAAYLENHVLVQWDSDLLEFLMQVSVTEEFTLPLAKMITGNSSAEELLERAAETGNFLFLKDGMYRLRPELIRALRRHASKTYALEVLNNYAYNAGLYYEMQGQIVPALAMFERCGNRERMKELLVRNARLNPGNGHYFALRRYYLQMEEKELEGSPVLMAGMSMLYSLLMQEEESEYWYDKLKAFESSAKGGQKREAISRLAYLEIALPHRESMDMIDIMRRMPTLLFDRGIGLPEFSVTSNCPSTMNGGKDFCHWSQDGSGERRCAGDRFCRRRTAGAV